MRNFKLKKQACAVWMSLWLIPGVALALDDVDRLEMKAQMAFAGKDYDLAIQCWSDAIKLSPNEAAIYVNRAETYAAKGDPDKQLADYAEAIRFDPDNEQAYLERAQFYRDKRDAALKKGAAGDDEDTDKAVADYAEMVRIETAGARDQKAAARAIAVKASKDLNNDFAAGSWTALLKLDPQDASAWFRLALFDELLLKSEKALADCNEALKIDPKNSDALALHTQMDAGWKWGSDSHPFNRQDKHAQAGEYDLAVDDCNFEIWLGRGAYAQRAAAYSRAGKWRNAVADYNEALRSGDEGIYAGRAHAYMQGGEYDKAAADFITAAAAEHRGEVHEFGSESDYAIAAQLLIHAAEAYIHGGKYDKAIAILKHNLKIVPKGYGGWSMDALAWLYATCPDAKFRDGAEAVKLVKQADGKQAPGDDPYSDDILAAAYAETGQWDEAVKCEKRAIQGDQNEEANQTRRETQAKQDIADGVKDTLKIHPHDTLETAANIIKEDEEETKEFSARLALYEQKKPCREMKEFLVGD